MVIFNKEDTQKRNGYRDVGDTINRSPFGGTFHRALLIEKERDPTLQGMPH